MRWQRADDPALGMRQIWLGPKGMRWPIDATFSQWRVAALLTFFSVLLLTLILPAFVPVALLAWVAASVPGRYLLPEHARKVTAVLVTLWLLLALLFVPSPMAWITPMPLVISLIFAPIVGVAVTRQVGHFITPERPTGYWMALLPRASAGPRRNPDREYRMTSLALHATEED